MGYYNDVCITLYKKDYVAMAERAKKECEDALRIMQSGDIFENGDDVLTWRNGWIKWGLQDGQMFIRKFLRDVPHVFRRIGETVGDIEEDFCDTDGDLSGYVFITTEYEIQGTEKENKI